MAQQFNKIPDLAAQLDSFTRRLQALCAHRGDDKRPDEQTEMDRIASGVDEVRRYLEYQQRFTGLKEKIWALSADTTLDEDGLISRLLEIIGPFFDVARASYYEFESAEGDAVCRLQWTAREIEEVTGFRLPCSYREAFAGMNYVVVNKENAPPQFRDEVIELLQQTGIESFFIVFYPDKHAPIGFFTFSSIQSDREWSFVERDIMDEVIRIVYARHKVLSVQRELHDSARLLERRVAERTREVEDEKQLLYVTLRSLQEGVITTDTNANISVMNSAAQQLTGVSEYEAQGKRLSDVIHCIDEQECATDLFRVLLQTTRKEAVHNTIYICAVVAQDGTKKDVECSIATIKEPADNTVAGYVFVLRDVTEHQRLQNELLRARKLESVGLMADNIANDFNNILAGVVTNLFMLKTDPSLSSQARELVNETEKTALKARKLSEKMLVFSQEGSPIREIISTADFLREAVGASLGQSQTYYQLDIANDIWDIEVDQAQINQMLQNILCNADEATGGEDSILISAHNISITDTISPDATERVLPLKPGSYIKLVVYDTGEGIPNEYVDKIFDPYFTTKEGAAGMGLTIAFAVASRHGGHITLRSQPGEYTSFTVYLPAKPSAENDGKKAEEKLRENLQRVLLMDDDEVVRSAVQRLLQRYDCEVELAFTGEEAVDIYQETMEHGGFFDLVIIDLRVSEGIDGMETLQRLKMIDPDVTSILFTGYSGDAVRQEYKKHGFNAAISKPFSINEFIEVIGSVL